MKYIIKGDSTAFYYIDVNIPSLIETGCGTNIIQGSVSLDNKTEDNCIIILPSIHHHLELWWADLKAQGLTKGDGFVYKITD
jgi:hypothetical protein